MDQNNHLHVRKIQMIGFKRFTEHQSFCNEGFLSLKVSSAWVFFLIIGGQTALHWSRA